jgi:hypothetical protein
VGVGSPSPSRTGCVAGDGVKVKVKAKAAAMYDLMLIDSATGSCATQDTVILFKSLSRRTGVRRQKLQVPQGCKICVGCD